MDKDKIIGELKDIIKDITDLADRITNQIDTVILNLNAAIELLENHALTPNEHIIADIRQRLRDINTDKRPY